MERPEMVLLPEVAMQPFCLFILLFFMLVTPLNPWYVFYDAFVLVLNLGFSHC